MSLPSFVQLVGDAIGRHTRTADAAERVRQIVLEAESGVPVANPGYQRADPSYARPADVVFDLTTKTFTAVTPPEPDPGRPFGVGFVVGPTTAHTVD